MFPTYFFWTLIHMILRFIRAFLMIVVLLLNSSCAKEKVSFKSTPIRSYSRTFNDMNDLHKAAAEEIGIDPISSRDDIKKRKVKLKEVKSNKYYMVDKLTHSLPFLVPPAEKLLVDIGKGFRQHLKAKKLSPHRIRVTSVLRTQDDLKKLNRRNVNSSANSAHIHATTFDISYVRFDKLDDDDKEVSLHELKQTLAEVLLQLKEEGRCYVKYEVKQGCFHITAR